MPIKFLCPGCGKGFSAADSLAGKTTNCNQCGQSISIPDPLETIDLGSAPTPGPTSVPGLTEITPPTEAPAAVQQPTPSLTPVASNAILGASNSPVHTPGLQPVGLAPMGAQGGDVSDGDVPNLAPVQTRPQQTATSKYRPERVGDLFWQYTAVGALISTGVVAVIITLIMVFSAAGPVVATNGPADLKAANAQDNEATGSSDEDNKQSFSKRKAFADNFGTKQPFSSEDRKGNTPPAPQDRKKRDSQPVQEAGVVWQVEDDPGSTKFIPTAGKLDISRLRRLVFPSQPSSCALVDTFKDRNRREWQVVDLSKTDGNEHAGVGIRAPELGQMKGLDKVALSNPPAWPTHRRGAPWA